MNQFVRYLSENYMGITCLRSCFTILIAAGGSVCIVVAARFHGVAPCLRPLGVGQ